MSAPLAILDPSKTPAGKALAFWREHEHTIVILAMVGAGLWAVAAVALAVKAAPVAMKIAAAKASAHPLLAGLL